MPNNKNKVFLRPTYLRHIPYIGVLVSGMGEHYQFVNQVYIPNARKVVTDIPHPKTVNAEQFK